MFINIQKAFFSMNMLVLNQNIEGRFKGKNKKILIDFLDIYENVNNNISGKTLNHAKDGPQDVILITILSCYYTNKAIQKKEINMTLISAVQAVHRLHQVCQLLYIKNRALHRKSLDI